MGANDGRTDWITLTEGERVVWSGRPSIFPYLSASAGSLVTAVFGLVVWVVGDGVIDVGIDFPSAVPWALLGGLVVLAAAIGLGRSLVRWRSRRFVVTSKEVYKKEGILSRTVTNLQHDQIQNTTFTQSLLGRLFSYGDVEIDTAGGQGAEVLLRDAADPDEVVSTITKQLSK